MVRVALATLGCKVNQCESAGIAEAVTGRGMVLVPFDQAADCYVINTCTVTGRTDYQSRQLIRRALRTNPSAEVFVTGCYAQRAPEEIARIPGVRLIAGNAEKAGLVDLIGQAGNGSLGVLRGDIRAQRTISPLGATVFPEHTRAFLKIQDGCNASCTYCVVPSARGMSRSLPPDRVLERLAELAGAGYREAVLTGIHLGAYGRDLTPGTSLAALVRQSAEERGLDRLRLSSIEPREVTRELIALFGSGRLCRHLHIPLQSGDDGILAAMGRNYAADLFADLIRRVHEAVPGIAVGSDVMAGFPGESEEAFSNTLRLIEALPLAYLHVFPFSPRPGTPAAAMPGQIPEAEKKRRAEVLRRAGTLKRGAFAASFIGTELAVLVEARTDKSSGLPLGLTDNYIPVALRGPGTAPNRIVRVRPESYANGRLIGEVIPP